MVLTRLVVSRRISEKYQCDITFWYAMLRSSVEQNDIIQDMLDCSSMVYVHVQMQVYVADLIANFRMLSHAYHFKAMHLHCVGSSFTGHH